MIRRANALMATQLRGKKRLVEEVEMEQEVPDKRSRMGESVSVSLFKTPQLGVGGIFDPPSQS